MSELENVKVGDTILEWQFEKIGFYSGKNFLLPSVVRRVTKTLIITDNERYKLTGCLFGDGAYWKRYGIEPYCANKDQSEIHRQYVEAQRMICEMKTALDKVGGYIREAKYTNTNLKKLHTQIMELKEVIKND